MRPLKVSHFLRMLYLVFGKLKKWDGLSLLMTDTGMRSFNGREETETWD